MQYFSASWRSVYLSSQWMQLYRQSLKNHSIVGSWDCDLSDGVRFSESYHFVGVELVFTQTMEKPIKFKKSVRSFPNCPNKTKIMFVCVKKFCQYKVKQPKWKN
mmetsp:Transcript_7044/g.7226  ORF Transcript_7044/g.7226 Transcript_7044/m.7226 type:complete len:104 (-) Transcript_7044:168-479(-)